MNQRRRAGLPTEVDALKSPPSRMPFRMRRYGRTSLPALLDSAFAGKLVPQDPTDEPAEELLERIRGKAAGQKGRSK